METFNKKKIQIVIKMIDGTEFVYDKTPASYIIDINADPLAAGTIKTDFENLQTLYNAAITGNTGIMLLDIPTQGKYIKTKNYTLSAQPAGWNGPFSYFAVATRSISYIYIKEIPFRTTY